MTIDTQFGLSHDEDDDAVASTSENFVRLHSPRMIRENEFVQPEHRDDMNVGFMINTEKADEQ